MIDTFEMTDMNGITTYVRLVNGETATIMTLTEYEKEYPDAPKS